MGSDAEDKEAYERLVEKAVEEGRAFIARHPGYAVRPFCVIVQDEEQNLSLEVTFTLTDEARAAPTGAH